MRLSPTRGRKALCVALAILPSVYGIFQDSAYLDDYHHELLGLPLPQSTFFHRPRREERATLLYTLSDLGVIGAVNAGTGKVVWRHLLATDKTNASTVGSLRPVEGENIVVSGYDNAIGAWDAMSGRSKWLSTFAGQVKDVEVMESAADAVEAKDILTLFHDAGKGVVRRLAGSSGNVLWEYRDTSSDVPLQVSTNVMNAFVVALHGARGGYNLKVTTLDPVTGKKVTEYVLSTKADVHAAEDVLLVGANSAAPFIAWTDKNRQTLKINLLGKTSEQTLPLKEADGPLAKVEIHAPHLVQSQPHFMVHSHSETANRADVYHIDLASGSIAKAYELPQLPGRGAIAISCQDANVYFTRLTEKEVLVVSSASHAILGRWPISQKQDRGHFVHGVSEIKQKDGNTLAVRAAALTTDENWLLVRNGEEAWVRSEGLSGGIAAQWVEIPASETLAHTLETEAHSSVVAAYVHRLRRHANDLQHLPEYLRALPKRLLSSLLPGDLGVVTEDDFARDSFGFNKIVIVATRRGRVYALHAGHQGKILWSQKAHDIPNGKSWNVKGMWVDSKSNKVIFRGSTNEHAILNITTGHLIDAVPLTFLPGLQSAPVVDTLSGPWMLPIAIHGQPAEVPAEWAPKNPLITRGQHGEVQGIRFETHRGRTKSVVAWTFEPVNERIVGVTTKPTHDPVASIGRVLGDRSVLYKYLSPNLVLVTAVSDSASTASFYLLDTISGDVQWSTTHSNVETSSTIPAVMTENWFAYSIFADVSSSTDEHKSLTKSHQLVVAEMFESALPNDRGVLGASSNISILEPLQVPNSQPALPYIATQSFVIPEAIKHLSVTSTRQGITTRQLLCVLESNGILGIARQVIDPRRPVGRDATSLEMEEGLFRYQPVIDIDPRNVLNHKREVIGVRDVITSPAVLESTSLVFAYGIDVFGTRVAPSAAFDILGKGFGKLSLVGTVLALWIGVVVFGPMVRRKQINTRWFT